MIEKHGKDIDESFDRILEAAKQDKWNAHLRKLMSEYVDVTPCTCESNPPFTQCWKCVFEWNLRVPF